VSRSVSPFVLAKGGTVFFDELGELPPDIQPKLLRVLEAREVLSVGSSTRYQPSTFASSPPRAAPARAPGGHPGPRHVVPRPGRRPGRVRADRRALDGSAQTARLARQRSRAAQFFGTLHRETGGNLSEMSRRSGLSRPMVREYLERHGLRATD